MSVWIGKPSTGGGVPEAPVDGKQYARQDATWTEVISGGSMSTFNTSINFNKGDSVGYATIVDPTMTTTKIIQCFFTNNLDEVAVLNMRVNERGRTAGVGFDLIAVAPFGAFGTYTVRCIISGT